MNWQQLEGHWEQFKGEARRKWGQLTDNDLEQAKGNYEKLVGKIKTSYGVTKEEAEHELAEIEQRLKRHSH